MKQINKFIIAVAALMAVSFGAYAQSGVSIPFIGQGMSSAVSEIPGANSGYLQFNALSTNSYGDSTLVWYKGFNSGYAGQIYTNPFTGVISNGGTNGFIIPNIVTNSSGIGDIELWSDRDGTTPSISLSADINGSGAAFTNTVTLNFCAIFGGGLKPSAAQNNISLAMTGNGTNDVIISTNLFTSGFLQGARKLRLVSVAATNAGTNGQVVNVWINGYKPIVQ